MEEKKDQFELTNNRKFFFNKTHKLVDFNTNNFPKLATPILDLRELKENKDNINKINNEKINYTNRNKTINQNIYTSPQKTKKILFKSSLTKKSLQTPLNLYISSNNNVKETSLNNNISKKDNLSPKLDTNEKNKFFLKRVNTGHISSDLSISNQKDSNNKLYNKIRFRNNKNLLTISKFPNALKSERDEKLIKTSILTERHSKNNIQINNLSRRSSINTKYINLNTIKNKKYLYKKTKTITDPKYFRKSNIFTKKHQNQNSIPIIVNPLLISEEDKIFDEMKKYLCFKYEQKKLKKKANDKSKNAIQNKGNASKLKKMKAKLQTEEQTKLDYLYLSTTKVNKKIRYVKRKKNKQDLAEYQNNLLDVIKPSLSDYTYTHLKDRLIDIRLKNSKKYQNNYKRIKEIEIMEEDIINDFNHICQKCLKTFRRVREQKEMVHSTNLKIKLPYLNFISCLKKKKKKKK